MPLSLDELGQLKEVVQRYVGAFVKLGSPPAHFAVSGHACRTMDEAVTKAFQDCLDWRICQPDDLEKCLILKELLQEEIAKLRSP